jgi:hypothetical protein
MQAADKALRDGLRRSSAPAKEEEPNWWMTGVEIVAGILLKPIDLMLTARDVYKEPGNPINYLGVFLPSGLRKAAKALAGQADKLDEAIETVKAGRAADQAEEAAKFAKPQGAVISGKLSRVESDRLREKAKRIWAAFTGHTASSLGLDIHHRIPLEWAHLFPDTDPNRLTNLRGIDPLIHRRVNAAWAAWKKSLNGVTPTPEQIEAQAAIIDGMFKDSWVLP